MDMETWTDIMGSTSQNRSPVAADEGYYLRASVTYTDSYGSGKTASAVTGNVVEERTVSNAAPSFKGQDDDKEMDGTQVNRTVDENSAKGSSIGKPVSASDADNDVLVYTLGGDDAARFDITNSTGQLKVKQALNFEADASTEQTPTNNCTAQNACVVTVTATDPSGADASQDVTITIENANEGPKFDRDTADGVQAPRTTLWVTENDDDNQLRTTKADADGTDDNLPPAEYVATDEDDGHTVPDTGGYALEGADKDKFGISDTAVLTVGGDDDHEPDYEKQTSYSITIVVNSGTGADLRRTRLDVTVNVVDAEDTGSVGLSQREPQIGRDVIATLTDDDGGVVVSDWMWERSNVGTPDDNNNPTAATCATADYTGAGSGVIDGASSAAYTPAAADENRCLRATVTYTDNIPGDSDPADTTDNDDDTETDVNMDGIAVSKVSERAVQESNPANAAPRFPDQDLNASGDQSDSTSRTVAENTKAGVNIGAPVDATDGDLLLYTLGGANAGMFGIDKNTGQLKTKAKLDYEALADDAKYYMVMVTATDPSGATDSIMVTVNVTDENDGAVITGEKTVSYPENGMDPVATFSATDQDGDDIAWSLAEKDAYKRFMIDGGVLSFKKSPNYESPNSAVTGGTLDERNVYRVTVQATGGTLNVVVTVTNVDEDGKVTFSDEGRFQPQVGRGLDATLSDPEGQSDARWQWARSMDMETWTDIMGSTSQNRSPVAADEGYYLRASVTYTDSYGSGKTASAVTGNVVEERTVSNAAPSFKGQDDDKETDGTQVNRTVAENSAKGSSIGKPVSASDSNNDVLVYTLGGDDAARFDITNSTGQLKVKQALNFEGSASAESTDNCTATANTCLVTVTATDPSGADASQDVTITIENANEGPKFDSDATTTLWVTENDDTNQLRTTKADADGTGDNLPPDEYVATDEDTIPATATGGITYALEGADKDKFGIDDTSAVLAVGGDDDHEPDYEKQTSYSITIVVSSGTGTDLRRTRLDVTVNVVDAEDGGSVSLSQREPQIGRDVIATLTDDDGGVIVSEWMWERSADGDNDDSNNPTAANCSEANLSWTSDGGEVIDGASSAAYTPTDDDENRCLRATVTYTDNIPGDSDPADTTDNDDDTETDVNMDGIAVSKVSERAVQESNPANTAPRFPDQDLNTSGDQSDSTSRTVMENTKAGVNIGAPVDATDGDLLLYTLGGANAGMFGIDKKSGQLKTKAKLDYEALPEDAKYYMVMVTATDPSGASDSIMVTVNITDENDGATITLGVAENTAPAFDASTATRNVDENMYAGTAVGDPVTAMDAGDTVTYTLSGSTYFGIDGSSGQISTRMMLDHEAMSTHTVTVTATDSEDATDTVDVTINVNNVHTGCDTAGNIDLVNDCEALLDSKDALGGSLNWAALPMSDWDGVTMSDGRVTAIDLRDQGLDGTIPGALGRLSALTSLNLRSNADLSGDIPGSLGDLSNLTVLNLHSNSHTGEIPDLSGTSLVELYLPGNDLTGSVPAWLNTMTDMTELWLWGNSLSGAMPDLSGMTSLNKLKLNGNTALTGIDAAMLPGGLRWLVAGQTDVGATAPDLSGTSLTTLWLNETGLSGAIPVANIPTSVTSLNLKDNSLSGTIPDMSGLENLRYLRLHRNDLSGDIPGTLGDLESIERIWAYDNDLMGISAGLANAADTLTHLYLNGNSFAEGTCLAGGLANVANNDFEMAGLAACGDGS